LIISCKNPKKVSDKVTHIPVNNTITHAKGFSIQDHKDFKKLTIHTSFQGDLASKVYYLLPKGQKAPDSLQDKNLLFIPVERIVVTSTTHIPMLEILEVENSLVGFPNTNYVSSIKTRSLIDQGKVQELGQEQNINTELLLDLQPELVIGFGVNNTSPVFKNIEKTGIPVLMNSDWLEETPLGKAEWLRFFGVLFQKDSLAKVKFDEVVSNYQSIQEKLLKATKKPTVLSGSLYQDVWYMPAGESFFAKFLTDANTDFLWKDTQGTGSLSLSLESVLDKAQKAEYWIAPGFYSSQKAMLQDSPHYAEFDAFQSGKLYTYALNKGTTGGVIYFELATARPDLVLQDLAVIFHQEIFPKVNMTFFRQLK
jgi:iron complex transport system substrate-binding protein